MPLPAQLIARRAIKILTLGAILGSAPFLASQQAIPTVRIGAQEWMRDNLNVTTFRNGDGIPAAADSADWVRAGQQRIPAWAAYADDDANRTKYGLLYNHYVVTDPRGICPDGFRVPSTADFAELEATLGVEEASAKLKASAGWANDGNGTDASGFRGLPGGFRTQNGVFFLESRVGYWWTDDGREFAAPTALAILLFDYTPKIFRIEYPQAIGQSVRCVRGGEG